GGDLYRLVIAEGIEVGGGSVVDCSYIELPAHEFLAPPATPDEVLTQGHAQHSPCHAVDREMDSRYDAVGRDACRLAVELVDHRWVSGIEVQQGFQHVRNRMDLRRVPARKASVPRRRE